MKRNIKIAAPPVKTVAAKAPARKIVVGKQQAKKAPVIVAKTVAAPSKPRVRQSNRITYDLPVSYVGESPYVNKRPSKTVIPIAEFGSKPNTTIHQRTQDALRDWKARFGNKPFARGNLDAGVLKILGWRGFLAHVDGDPASDTCQFQFTKAALSYNA